MNRILPLIFVCAFLLLATSVTVFAQCDGERWSVKTGTDSDRFLVNLSSPTQTTIQSLTSIAQPDSLPDDARVKPTETTTWVLNATMIKYALSYDSDYHIVFRDSAGRTMIGEIPDPGCINSSSPFRSGIAHARAQFDAMFSPTTNFQDTSIPVQITGVGYFDYDEGQEGIASNNIELHPIIDIIFGPTFSITSSAPSLSIARGSSGTTSVSSTILGNFNSAVSLNATGFPAGASVNFSPSSIAAPGSGSSTMTVNVGASTPVGSYNIVINGSGGGQTRSIAVTLNVVTSSQQLIGNAGFENGTNASPWTVTAGVIDNNNSIQASHSGTWKAWLNGYGVVHTDTLYQQVSIPSSSTSASLSFWRHIDTKETTTTAANDTLKVQVRNTAGTVLATLATYSNLNAASGYTQSTFDVTSYKGQTVQIYLIGVENSSLKTSFVVDDFALAVNGSSGTPDFGITATPSTLSSATGSSKTSAIATTVSNGFNSSIALSATGMPAGVTASFSPASINAPGAGSSTLTLTVGSSTTAGTYTISVKGTAGAVSHTASISLTVTSGGGGGGTSQQLIGNPGFENGSSNASPWTATAGVIDNSTFEAPHAGSWKAWLSGWGVVHTDTLYQQVSIPSGATSASLSFWRHIDTTETTTTAANDTFKVQVRNSSGTVLATLATYSNLDAAAGFSQVTFDLLSYKGQTIQIYLVGVENGSLKTSFVVDDFALDTNTASGSPDFTIAASPTALTAAAGSNVTSTLNTTVSNGFNSSIALSATGMPAGVTTSFSPASINAPGAGSSTLTLTVGSSTATGTYTIIVTGTAGAVSHTASISLTVSSSPDFAIAASPTTLTTAAGSNATSTITTTVSNGFNSSIALSATGMPAGVTASFSPASINAPGAGSSTLTLTVGSSTATGTYTIVVKGTAGAVSHTVSINLTVSSSPDFAIAASPNALTAAAGSNVISTLTTTVSNGFNSSIALSATGMPAGVTASFSPASINAPGAGSSTLTLTVGSSTATGTYTIVVKGTAGAVSHTVSINLTVSSSPDFAIAASPTTLTTAAGSNATSTITTTVSNGFNSSIALSATGMPAGVTASFSPASINAPGAGSSTLTLTVGSSTAAGTYTINAKGTAGAVSHTASISLTVTSGGGGGGVPQQLIGNPGFENGSNEAPWIASTGVINDSDLELQHSGLWKAWLNGWGIVHTDSIYQQVSIPSGATAATLSFWRHIDTTETTTTTANDTLKVQIRNSSGTVLATLATYSNLDAAVGFSQVTFDLLSYKGQTIQIYLVGDENGDLESSFVVDDFELNVTTPTGLPDFTIAASPATLTTVPGSNATSTITTTVSNGFNSSVALAATGLPAGTTAGFSKTSIAAPGAGSSVLTLSVGSSTAPGTYSIGINGTGGGTTRFTSVNLTVGGTSNQLIGNPGFENGSTNIAPWTATTGVIDNSSSQAARTGLWKAWLNGWGTAHTDSLSQQVTIPSGATGATLSFWRHIDTTETANTAYDTLKVQIRNSSGTVLATLATYSNTDAAAGYTQVSFNLTSYKGQTIQIYLLGVEDGSLGTSFVLDDFSLNVTTP